MVDRAELAGVEGDVELVADAASLAALVARAARAPLLALDTEADGLHAYRAKLCTVQLAFGEEARGPLDRARIRLAVVDAVVLPPEALAEHLGPLLGPAGPVKVVHDLAFDARILADAGAPLGGEVRDTAIAARYLGEAATGLATLLAAELGVHLDKRMQRHDWRARPLTAEALGYLGSDVAHLLHLDATLAERVRAAGIEAEVATECAFRVASADAPPRDARPSYARVQGAAALEPAGRAALRRLFALRETAACRADVPAHRVASAEALLSLARAAPRTPREAERALASAGIRQGALGPPGEILEALAAGARDGDVPEAERPLFERPRLDPDERAAHARRRQREAELSGWRAAEAKARGVDPLVVLPGHALTRLAELFASLEAEPGLSSDGVLARLTQVPGLGEARLARYGAALARLAGSPPAGRPG